MHEPTFIERDVLAALKGQPLRENQFNSLALDVFRYQFNRNPAYQNFCKASEIQPDKISQWQDIPAVPTDTFKHSEYPLATFPWKTRSKPSSHQGQPVSSKGITISRQPDYTINPSSVSGVSLIYPNSRINTPSS